MLERCHIPNFGGRIKPILVIRIRKHKGCTEEWQGGGELPKQNQAANTQRNSQKKKSPLIVGAIATKEKAVVCTGLAGSAEGKAGAAVPLQAGGACQAALVPALCL